MISYLDLGLTAIALGLVALILLIGYRPSLTDARGGKVLAFLSFFVMPILVTWVGTSQHIQHSKSTSFCLSCHVMEPYGQSLRIDDPAHIPAVHYQNNLTPRDEACFTCHTTYTMFGDLDAKLTGMKHVYVYYLGTVPEKIQLYQPFRNRECLHCHEGARSFEQQEDHAGMRADLISNGTSCLECHSDTHDVANLGSKPLWTGAETGASR
jgi:nitrate/TMAO reductase-like tetraheme cytochrome c subunit